MAPLLLVLLLVLQPGALGAYDCSAHPWVDEVVRLWFTRAYQAARDHAGKQTSEAALDHISNIKWGTYFTGKSMGVLSPDPSARTYNLTFQVLHKHNEAHKPDGIQKVAFRAIQQHGEDLFRELGGRELKFIFGTEDQPVVDVGSCKLPSFQMCASPYAQDVPIPDFTFEIYSQTHYTNSSWWEVRRLLLLKAGMVRWEDRGTSLFMRGDAGVGYRKVLMPFMHQVQVNRSHMALFGRKVDVHNTGFYAGDMKHFSYLDAWCHHRYLLHTSGLSYSASLKYKLACGAVVLQFKNEHEEFYYPALKSGTHLLVYPEGDHEALIKEIAPRIKRDLGDLDGSHHDTPPPIALAAREFATQQLTDAALSCYWYKVLAAYGKLYFAEKPEDVPKEVYIAP